MLFNGELIKMAQGQEVFAVKNWCNLNKALEKNTLKNYLKVTDVVAVV